MRRLTKEEKINSGTLRQTDAVKKESKKAGFKYTVTIHHKDKTFGKKDGKKYFGGRFDTRKKAQYYANVYKRDDRLGVIKKVTVDKL